MGAFTKYVFTDIWGEISTWIQSMWTFDEFLMNFVSSKSLNANIQLLFLITSGYSFYSQFKSSCVKS